MSVTSRPCKKWLMNSWKKSAWRYTLFLGCRTIVLVILHPKHIFIHSRHCYLKSCMQPCLPAPHVYFWKTASYGGLWQSFSERCAKSYATGTKNFLFHDSLTGARSSAVIYSLVETAKANHLNVFQYLYTLLLYMPDYKNEPAGVEAMMPWSGFIKERCSKVMDTETETPENRGQIPF